MDALVRREEVRLGIFVVGEIGLKIWSATETNALTLTGRPVHLIMRL
jgi:hypothetical protein